MHSHNKLRTKHVSVFHMKYDGKWLFRSEGNRRPREVFVFLCFSNKGFDPVDGDGSGGFRWGGRRRPSRELESRWRSLAERSLRHNDGVSWVEGRYEMTWYDDGDADHENSDRSLLLRAEMSGDVLSSSWLLPHGSLTSTLWDPRSKVETGHEVKQSRSTEVFQSHYWGFRGKREKSEWCPLERQGRGKGKLCALAQRSPAGRWFMGQRTCCSRFKDKWDIASPHGKSPSPGKSTGKVNWPIRLGLQLTQ